MDPITLVANRVVSIPQRLIGLAADAASNLAAAVAGAKSLQRRIAALESELARVDWDAARVESLEREVARLRALSGLPMRRPIRRVAADIVGYFPSVHRLALNVGASSGVKPGAPVVAPSGVVGQVVETSGSSCFVNLMTNVDFGVGARVVRAASQEAGIARGQNSQRLLLTVYDERADVQVGDLITTSGLSKVYPEGIPIGRVTEIWTDRTYGLRQGEVQPAIELAKLREVVVLVR